MSDLFANAKLVVVKVGSALLVDGPSGELRRAWLESLCADVMAIKARRQARDPGVVRRHCPGTTRSGPQARRVAAGRKPGGGGGGQVKLAQAYADIFASAGIVAAQILLTLGDTEERDRYLNARATLGTLLDLGAVPVINENDTVATAEIRFGDNDRLGARVASMMGADRLILLSDVDGLYTADPSRDSGAGAYSRSDRHHAGDRSHGGGKHFRRGPWRHGVQADRRQDRHQCRLRRGDRRGESLHPLATIAKGARHTIFRASVSPATARKRWIAGVLKPVGSLVIDDGAVRALGEGKSLLPAGVRQIDGRFERGDAVLVKTKDGREIARGLTAYNATDAERIAGKRTVEIEAILGYRGRDEMIHRDDLILTDVKS